mmetsp:Transcript_34615/g.85136  ORF Transcript_34615/g.85136 Transcript_34615/m.85136 type:complete len:228 (-) Transcript_34615:7-690(-)
MYSSCRALRVSNIFFSTRLAGSCPRISSSSGCPMCEASNGSKASSGFCSAQMRMLHVSCSVCLTLFSARRAETCLECASLWSRALVRLTISGVSHGGVSWRIFSVLERHSCRITPRRANSLPAIRELVNVLIELLAAAAACSIVSPNELRLRARACASGLKPRFCPSQASSAWALAWALAGLLGKRTAGGSEFLRRFEGTDTMSPSPSWLRAATGRSTPASCNSSTG